ncbi:hypothetical protein RHMOL_Rhmol06G0006800 [Rhododendron molle]|uniref:Uncharacterized protein n=1 Tax=Rhododendron molle TaxID=49168 RepID=A0ACC0N782_RHOML|nr:hypothetical protein RHMOL_Rhmol06G0006800 [Rhododendron molle]
MNDLSIRRGRSVLFNCLSEILRIHDYALDMVRTVHVGHELSLILGNFRIKSQ